MLLDRQVIYPRALTKGASDQEGCLTGGVTGDT